MPDIIPSKINQAAIREANEGLNSALNEIRAIDSHLDSLNARKAEQEALAAKYRADLAEFIEDLGGDAKVHAAERQPDNTNVLVDQDEKAARAEAAARAKLEEVAAAEDAG